VNVFIANASYQSVTIARIFIFYLGMNFHDALSLVYRLC